MQSSELIAPLAIQTPIAINGDKNIPPQTATGTDTSSINLGFLPITSEPLDDGGQAPERIDFNGMFYLSTDQRVFLQNGGFITYNANVSTAIGGYPKGAVLAYLDNSGNFNFVESEIENNQYNFITNPAYINGTYWSYRNVLKDLSNINQNITSIPPTSLTNFDGQWVYKKALLSNSVNANTYTIDLKSYLGVSAGSTVQYEVLFAQNYYRNTSNSTFQHGIVYSDVISDYSTTDSGQTYGCMFSSSQGRTTGYLGTIPVKTTMYLKLFEQFDKQALIAVGYRRLGTNQ